MATLTALTGPLSGQEFELAGELVIGRESADLRVPDPEVSRRHASLKLVPGGVEVTDLGSLNGTWLDEQRIGRPVVVQDGARVRVGETSFRVGAQVPARTPAEHPEAPATPVAAAAPPVAAAGPAPRAGAAPGAGPAPRAGAFSPASPPRTRRPAGVATRLWLPAAASFAAILATAIALLLYFGLR